MSKWYEIGIERMKMSDDNKVVEIMTEPDDDGNVYIEIPFDVLAKFVAAQQKMYPTLGKSAASDSESTPAPKRVKTTVSLLPCRRR